MGVKQPLHSWEPLWGLAFCLTPGRLQADGSINTQVNFMSEWQFLSVASHSTTLVHLAIFSYANQVDTPPEENSCLAKLLPFVCIRGRYSFCCFRLRWGQTHRILQAFMSGKLSVTLFNSTPPNPG